MSFKGTSAAKDKVHYEIDTATRHPCDRNLLELVLSKPHISLIYLFSFIRSGFMAVTFFAAVSLQLGQHLAHNFHHIVVEPIQRREGVDEHNEK